MKTEIEIENIEIEIDEEAKQISKDINHLDYFIKHKIKTDTIIYLKLSSKDNSITTTLIDIIVNNYGYIFNSCSAENDKIFALFYKVIS